MSSLLSSFAVLFSSGASAVAVVVATPSSAPFDAALDALDERVRGVLCDISVLLSRLRLFLKSVPLIYASFPYGRNALAVLFAVK